jgi:uncharacterized membrane protein YphA (DoxX/SURF4 family)
MMSLALSVAQGLLTVLFVAAGSAKVARTDRMQDEFERFGFSEGFMLLTGTSQLLGAAALLAGYWSSLLAALGGGIILVNMLGAVWSHLVRGGDPVVKAVPPSVLGLLAAWVLLAQAPLL